MPNAYERPAAKRGRSSRSPKRRDAIVKRFTLNEYNAEHVYEWLRMYWRGDEQRFGGCVECGQIGRRLERFIGPAAVRHVARLVKKYPIDAARTAKEKAKKR